MPQLQEQRYACKEGSFLPQQELRIAVANLYNVLYREGKESKYTFEVCFECCNQTPWRAWKFTNH